MNSNDHGEQSDALEEKHRRNRRQRRQFVREWVAFVRTHPDAEWGEQVNRVVNSQIQSARAFQDDPESSYPKRDGDE